MNFGKLVFVIGHVVLRPRVLINYRKLQRNKHRTLASLRKDQLESIREYLIFCRDNVPYFRSSLSEIDLSVDHFSFDSVTALPILQKQDIKTNLVDLFSAKARLRGVKRGQTGGSTGRPLKYLISKECASMAQAILYRGWGYGGYRLGDKMAVMAGGSLVSKRLSRRARAIAYIQNIRKYSSYGVSDETFLKYFKDMKEWQPKFLRGYVSSIFEFAKFVDRNALSISFEAVFTTAEMLHPHQRSYIEKVLRTEVFDNYGLNDGSITAFECNRHAGFHIDLERGYLEIDNSVDGTSGPVLATAFMNRATQFVRYDTGDIAELTNRPCECGLPFPMLKGLCGRETDALKVNGCVIGSPVLTVLMSGIDVNRYQFVQDGLSSLKIIIERGGTYDSGDEEFIRSSLFSQAGSFDLRFSYESADFRDVNGAKHKLVIRDFGSV